MNSLVGKGVVFLALVIGGTIAWPNGAPAEVCCKCSGSIGNCPEDGSACSGGFTNGPFFASEVCLNVPCSLGACTPDADCRDDTDCAPVGACCLPDGSCSEDSADVCAIRNGSYEGDDSACGVGLCSSKSCCRCAGSISEICPATGPACSEGFTSEVDYVGDVCLDAPCSLAICTFGQDCDSFAECGALGACCFSDGSCSRETESSCIIRSGAYRGDGTSCADGCAARAATAPVIGTPGLIIGLGALVLIAFAQLFGRLRYGAKRRL
jgi:hypothetical protein